MPYQKVPRKTQPLWHDSDYKAQKKGVRSTVYSVNGDEYTGEWLDNKKHGEIKLGSRSNLDSKIKAGN